MGRAAATSGVVRDGTLVFQQEGKPVAVALDSPAWQAWLEQATSFTFQHAGDSFTARKVRASNGRGGWYWYAYRRRNGHLSNLYLGISAKLTPQRLYEAAQALAAHTIESTTEQTTPAMHEYTMERVDTSATPASTEQVVPAATAHERAPLLVTKFYPPRLPAQHVARPRLTELLDTSILRPLTLVSAPAGSGKTTLLAEWASMTAVPVAWVSLEAADNDPACFLAYFQASLARLEEKNNLATDLVSWPASEQDYERVLTHILNDLTCRLQQDVVVILDDAHLLTSEAVHGALQFLLDHLPTRLHLIIGTRVDPPLPLARWRVRGQLSEVRTEELRFVPFEIEALVGAMGLVLSEEATSLLEQRTEGWIAGIQLLTLALRTRVDAAAFLHAFHGTHRFFS